MGLGRHRSYSAYKARILASNRFLFFAFSWEINFQKNRYVMCMTIECGYHTLYRCMHAYEVQINGR